MKILVVDDNPVDVKLFRLVLSVAGHDVNGAEAAEAALADIKHDKPRLMLVDLALPGMDGMTLVRRIKADPETRGIFVVVVTGHPSWWKQTEALMAGCDAYLVKPVNIRKLPQHLNAIATRKNGPRKPGPGFLSAELLDQLYEPARRASAKARKQRSHEHPDR